MKTESKPQRHKIRTHTIIKRKQTSMSTFDIRYAIILAINIMKSQASIPWDWDPYELMSNLTWSKFWLLFTLFLVFSFTSFKVPLTCPIDIWHVRVRVRVGEFSTTLVVLMVTSLLLPQLLFWYTYPIIVLLFMCSSWVFKTFKSFLHWARAILVTVPDLNISLSSVEVDGADLEDNGVDLEREHVALGDGDN